MHKQEFIANLRSKLSGLPSQEVEERLAFYSEMIDDRIEEGLTEQEAVSDIGPIEEIAVQIIADIPLAKIAKERIKPKRELKAWEIVLLVLGSPIWFSLAVAAFAVMLSLYAVLWSLIISAWAAFASFAACGVCGMVAGGAFALGGNGLTGIAMVGAGLVCTGLAILLLFGCKVATKGCVLLTKKIALGIKSCFVGKEKAQ